MDLDLVEMATAYQRSAIVAAACATGIADALAEGPLAAHEAADQAGISLRGAEALLRAMRALGLAERDGDDYLLSAGGAPLASGHPDTVARIVAKEWFFYEAWSRLPESVRTGRAAIAPWGERLASDPETGLTFLHALDDLGRMFGAGLVDLCPPLPPGARLLDAGGGSGVHAARLAEARGLEATVLDLPAVAPLVGRLHPELGFVAGDIEAPGLGRTEDEAWDAVLLANVLHDGPRRRARAMVAGAASCLAPGGALIVYEWLNDGGSPTPVDVALFDVMMLVENPGGVAYRADEIVGWLEAAGLRDVTVARGEGPIGVVHGTRPA